MEEISKMTAETTSADLCLTLSSAGAGCGAPAVKIDMRPPLEDDIITEISGFTIHIRAAVEKYLEDSEILVEDTFWGKKLKVSTVFGCR